MCLSFLSLAQCPFCNPFILMVFHLMGGGGHPPLPKCFDVQTSKPIPCVFIFLRTLLSNGHPVSAFLSITCELFSSRRRVWGVCSAYPLSPIPYPLSFRTLCQKHPGVGVFLILQTFNFQLSTFNLEGRLVD